MDDTSALAANECKIMHHEKTLIRTEGGVVLCYQQDAILTIGCQSLGHFIKRMIEQNIGAGDFEIIECLPCHRGLLEEMRREHTILRRIFAEYHAIKHLPRP